MNESANKLREAAMQFQSGQLTLKSGALFARVSLSEFISYVSNLGIPIIDQTSQEFQADVATLEVWLSERGSN